MGARPDGARGEPGIDSAGRRAENLSVPACPKILVFAHVPPPHHGQSAMVRLMLDGLGSGRFGDFEIHHVDARFSDTMEEIGGRGLGKVARAVRFALRAIWLRMSRGVGTLYYIPAPPKEAAMIRDWLVMAMCRPFFPRVVLHWHAVGLGDWTMRAQKSGGLGSRTAAWLNRRLLGRHQCSLVLTEWGRADVAVFRPREVRVVPNGIADPCPDFDEALLGSRREKVAAMRRAGEVVDFRICYLGHCTDEKGLWDAMEAVALATVRARESRPGLRISLRVAGEFPSEEDRRRFHELAESLCAGHGLADGWVEHAGFVGGEAKRRFLEAADCLVFPTRYAAESFGLVAAEALAFGMPPVTSDWRMLPELMGKLGLPVAKAGDAESFAAELVASIGRDDPAELRAMFCRHFTERAHLEALARALGG